MNNVLKFLATGAGISLLPAAILKGKKNTGAGLLGTFEGLLLYLFCMPLNNCAYTGVLIVFLVLACYISDRVDFADGRADNPKIVIDEIAGFFVAAAFLPRTGMVILLAFILFRFFDAAKFGPVKMAERFGHKLPVEKQKKYFTRGAAIVLDDVVAGIMANIILQTALFLKLL